MEKNFIISSVEANILPTKEKPYVVEVISRQPVKLKAFRQEVAATTVLVLSPGAPSLPSPEIVSRIIKEEATEDVGIILTNPKLEVVGVIGPRDIRARTAPRIAESREYGILHVEYERLPGRIKIEGILVYKCPVEGCDSFPVYVFQEGQTVPPCPIHNQPRVCKKA